MNNTSKKILAIGLGTVVSLSLWFCLPARNEEKPQKTEKPTPPPFLAPRLTGTIDTMAFIKAVEKEMLRIEGGSFTMGNDTLSPDTRPAHTVTVNSFYMAKHPVTLDLFTPFVTATGYRCSGERTGGAFVVDHDDEFAYKTGVTWECDERGQKRSPNDGNYPVLFISWNDADSFCHWLSALTGQTYRLPTEAEWEFAASGGNKSRYYAYSGSSTLNEVAWYGLNSELRVHPVGQKRPNELGLYDMTGLVWEWCSDWYSPGYYAQSPIYNPAGPAHGQEKVCKGGCYLTGLFADTYPQITPAYRGKDVTNMAGNAVSFRLVREL